MDIDFRQSKLDEPSFLRSHLRAVLAQRHCLLGIFFDFLLEIASECEVLRWLLLADDANDLLFDGAAVAVTAIRIQY